MLNVLASCLASGNAASARTHVIAAQMGTLAVVACLVHVSALSQVVMIAA